MRKKQWNECFIYENNSLNNNFLNILLAGTTYPDVKYDIRRNHHDWNFYVFEYVMSGSGYIEYENRVYPIVAGDCYFIRNDCYCHYYSNINDPYQKIWINASGELLDFMTDKFCLNKLIIKQIDTAKESILRIHTVLSKIYNDNDSLSLTTEIAGIIFDLLCRLSDYKPFETASNLTQAQIIKFFIDDHVYRKITLKDISNHVFLSQVQVIRIYKKKYNCTPIQYMKNKRLECSKRILANTDMEIQQIARMLNFANGQCYAKQFKALYKITPTEYRNSILN